MDQFLDWFREILSDWGMTKFYMACAATGGFILVSQLGLNMLGLADGDIDVDGMDGEDGSFSVLSVRAIAGFITFFGLVGWMGQNEGWSTPVTALAATAAGTSVMLIVALIMRAFTRLTSSGTLDPSGAIGCTARVYLRVPAENTGKGKITVSVQGRSAELSAFTRGPELPTGSECYVVAMATHDTFEVSSVAAAQAERNPSQS